MLNPQVVLVHSHKRSSVKPALVISAFVIFLSACSSAPPSAATSSDMSFFITSKGAGKGADFGGLAGADAHCQSLAQASGAGSKGGKVWKAYLSNMAINGGAAVNARDRIGSGPWRNAKGMLIAHNAGELHAWNAINKQTALNEKGATISGRGDTPNQHDVLTGSTPDGMAPKGDADLTCGNWTKSGTGSAIVGHHDRIGLRDDEAARSWNSSHPSRGCSDEALISSGGAGLLDCFAAN